MDGFIKNEVSLFIVKIFYIGFMLLLFYVNIQFVSQVFEDIDEISIKIEDTFYDEKSCIMEVSVQLCFGRSLG